MFVRTQKKVRVSPLCADALLSSRGMHLVALTRFPRDRSLDQDLQWLAQLMGMLPYEARLRLSSGLPVILTRGIALNVAQQNLSALRAHGFGAVAIDEAAAPSSEHAQVAASFELADGELRVAARANQSSVIRYPQLIACVRAIEVSEEEQATETVEKKFSLGRTALSGGLMTSKTVRKSINKKSGEHEQVAYLFRHDSSEPLMLRERALSYAGLGSERGHSAAESLSRLIAALRQRAPNMLVDDRLCQRKRRVDLAAIRGTSSEQVRSSTNAGANDLAAYILVHAHLQEQL